MLERNRYRRAGLLSARRLHARRGTGKCGFEQCNGQIRFGGGNGFDSYIYVKDQVTSPTGTPPLSGTTPQRSKGNLELFVMYKIKLFAIEPRVIFFFFLVESGYFGDELLP